MSEENNDRKFSENILDEYWDNLSIRDREKAFYCVVKLLNESREDGLAMRETLYDTFDFKPSMYNVAVDAGFDDLYESYQEKQQDTKYVKRLEIIDESGRAYVNMNVSECNISIQDTGNTMKLFVSTDEDTKDNMDQK
ncbi:MAG: hypothetical protein CBD74_14190 [Saprospirales bacterium TMED214]|nr:MAG: hypothetical protein CBD74_14190 [Saprospirales bacterium TMED214]